MASNTSICRQLVDHSIQICRAFQKGSLLKADAEAEIEAICNDYSQKNSEIDSLINFVQKASDIHNFAISPVTAEIGWSGNPVFWVKDVETKEIKLFLKVFEKDSKNFLSELYGLDYLQRVQGLVSLPLKAIGKFYIDGRCYFSIAEIPAQGHSFQYYYNEVAKYCDGSKQREDSLQLLIQGSRLCGIALSHLHTHEQGKWLPFPKETEDAMRADLERAISKLKVLPQKGIEIEQLKKCVDNAIERMKLESHYVSIAHGDIKLIHAFYYPRNQQISLIGSHQLIKSIRQDGSPQGIPAQDYYAFTRSLFLNRFGYTLDEGLRAERKELLTSDEAIQVIDSFKDGYRAAGGPVLTKAEEDFLLLSHNLMFINHLDRVFQEPDLTRLKDLIAISLENLRFRLKAEFTDSLLC